MIKLLFITLAPILAAIVGDKLLEKCRYPALRAVVDSLTHGIIGLLSWLIIIVSVYPTNYIISPITELFLSALVASFIDVDHFIAAKSLKLHDAMNLGSTRAPVHSTTLLFLITIPFIIVSKKFRRYDIYRFTFLILVSIGSHHLRDGVRRGLWFPPFGSTSPLPHLAYLASIGLLPHLIRSFVYIRPYEIFIL